MRGRRAPPTAMVDFGTDYVFTPATGEPAARAVPGLSALVVYQLWTRPDDYCPVARPTPQPDSSTGRPYSTPRYRYGRFWTCPSTIPGVAKRRAGRAVYSLACTTFRPIARRLFALMSSCAREPVIIDLTTVGASTCEVRPHPRLTPLGLGGWEGASLDATSGVVFLLAPRRRWRDHHIVVRVITRSRARVPVMTRNLTSWRLTGPSSPRSPDGAYPFWPLPPATSCADRHRTTSRPALCWRPRSRTLDPICARRKSPVAARSDRLYQTACPRPDVDSLLPPCWLTSMREVSATTCCINSRVPMSRPAFTRTLRGRARDVRLTRRRV